MSDYLITTHRDIAWFKQAYELGQLEMKPPFQRNLVWTVKQKSFLIDSILNKYPVPELYMQDIVGDKGDKKYIVVDGQQRITACLEFLANQFQIDGKDSPSFADLSFDDLTVEQKRTIYSYSFLIRLLPEISDIELRDIFSRLNRNNVVLNAQELRQATYWGYFIHVMNELAEKDVWRYFGIFTSNDVKRMLDVEFISELSIAVLHGIQNKKVTLDRYYQLYEEEFQEQTALKEIFDIVTRELIHLLPFTNKTRWSKKTDFYTLFVLLAKKKDQLPLSKLQRLKGEEILIEVAGEVDEFVSADKQKGDISKINEFITQYGANLRASSDLGARKKREEALEKLLEPMFL